MTLHITHFEGASALSEFRARQLLPQLQAVHDRISGVRAQFVHLATTETRPDDTLTARLAALLTYGEPFAAEAAAGSGEAVRIVVTPRFGTVSPWASKATDIAHNCGLAVKRVERVTAYHIGLLSGALDEVQWAALASALHDAKRGIELLGKEVIPALREHQSALVTGKEVGARGRDGHQA